MGAKGKATVSTTSTRQRSKSVGSRSKDGVHKAKSEPPRRRYSMDSVAPIRPKPSFDYLQEYSVNSQAINSMELNAMMNPDSSSTSSSTVIMLSSSDSNSPLNDQVLLDPINSFYDLQSVGVKPTWTPPPGDLEEAFHFKHDPIMTSQNIRSPMLH